MTTPLQESPRRRWPRVLIAILAAILVLIIGYLVLHQNTTQPDANQPDVAPKAQDYTWYFDANNKATRATGRDGEVLYDSGRWSETDYAAREYGIYSSKFVATDLDEVGASLTTPDKTVKGVTSLEVIITTDQFGALAEAYNALDRGNHGAPPMEHMESPAEFMVREVLTLHTFRNKIDVPFVAVDPKTEKNQVVADAYAKGYEPWELVKGTPDFDYSAKYVWDFTCTRYDVVNKDKTALKKLQQSMLPLQLRLEVGDGSSPGAMDFWQGGEYWSDTKVPCGVEVVGQKPTPTPTPPPKDNPQPEPKPSWPGDPKNPDQPG